MKGIFTAAALMMATLSGCATTLSQPASRVLLADEKMVEDCKFLGPVSGSSGQGNLLASVGMNNARNECIEGASKLGATHVVITSAAGGFAPSAQGRAYKCEPSR